MDQGKVESAMMLNSIFQTALNNLVVDPNAKTLVAVSGGRDSMCLLQLCLQNKLTVEVAHVNYGLRGDESAADEDLVKAFCTAHAVPFHVSNWTPDQLNSGSVQMQCRDHRYAFFEQLMDEHELKATFLAHHFGDNVETTLLNLFGGTGINGLAGMPAKRDRFFRPMLDATRDEIQQYVQQNEVPYRDDGSNFESKYDRNFVRNELLPIIEAKFNGAKKNIGRSVQNLSSAKRLLDHVERSLKPEYFLETETSFTCRLKALKTQPGHQYLLFSWLCPFGFNADQIDGILDQNTGAEFLSTTHRVVVSRDIIQGELISSKPHDQTEYFDFEKPPRGWAVSSYLKEDNWTPDQQENVGEFDAEKLSQLKIREWREGDKFKPLGMNRWKKLSDFFIDEKLSILEKEKVKLLVSDGEIIWIVGKRMDNRFKVNKDTQTLLRLTYDPNN